MSPFAIRSLLAVALLALGATGLVGCPSHARVAPSPRATPSSPAVVPSRPDLTPIPSIELGADVSDLRPLARAIGDARVVLLGEQTHADGTTFVAKTRLVRFL